jgi:hypothetical protein
MIASGMIDYLHEKAEDYDNHAIIPEEERQYRERLRLTIGKLKVSKEQGTYWSTDDSLRRLLSYRPSKEDMKLILRPLCYLSEDRSIFDDKSLERERYFISLQKRLIEYLLDKYKI